MTHVAHAFTVGDRVRYVGGEDDGAMTIVGFVQYVDGTWVRCHAYREGKLYTRVYPATDLVRDGGAP